MAEGHADTTPQPNRPENGQRMMLMRKSLSRTATTTALLAALVLLSGCASIGPGRMLQDRTDYISSYTESWKRQILLNIVKVRYAEPIFFMDVGDIVAGYSMETGGNAGFSRTIYDNPAPITDNNNPVFGDFGKLEFGLSTRYTDRPTITYKPMTGAPFRLGVMSALPVRNIMVGLDTGISAKFLFNLGVRSINGLRNSTLTASGSVPAQEGFKRAVEIISLLQLENAVRVRVEHAQNARGSRLYLTLGGKRPSPEAAALISELRDILNLDPAVYEYEITIDPEVENRRQIAIQAFSLMQILASVAARVDIPAADIDSRRALPSIKNSPGSDILDPVAVHSGGAKPADAYTAIAFHGHWFWVDDRDILTKRVFSFLMLAFTLMEEKNATLPPQLTIPVQ